MIFRAVPLPFGCTSFSKPPSLRFTSASAATGKIRPRIEIFSILPPTAPMTLLLCREPSRARPRVVGYLGSGGDRLPEEKPKVEIDRDDVRVARELDRRGEVEPFRVLRANRRDGRFLRRLWIADDGLQPEPVED